jgi:hypothetical protein
MNDLTLEFTGEVAADLVSGVLDLVEGSGVIRQLGLEFALEVGQESIDEGIAIGR